MTESATPYVVPIAWYDEADYRRLAAHRTASDRGGQSGSNAMPYAIWRRDAMRDVFATLEAGRAVALVTVRAGDYRAWLGSAGDTAAARGTYVAHCSVGAA